MADEPLASSHFWRVWTLLGLVGTTLAGARLLVSTAPAPLAAPRATAAEPAPPIPKREPDGGAAPAATREDQVLARLAVSATAPERCALLERVPASEDTQPTYAITALLDRAQHDSVRACAARALARQPTAEAHSFLSDLAEDPVPDVHRSALDALAIRGDSGRAVVVEATHHDDLELRVSAVEALLKAHDGEAYVVATRLMPEIEDPDSLASLIDAVGESHDPRAATALLAWLDEADRESHLHAITALGELGVASDLRVIARLQALLEVGSSEEFSAAATALNALARGKLESQLRSLLASGNAQRQELALSELLSLDLPDRRALLEEQLGSGDHARVSLALRRLIAKPEATLATELESMAQRSDRAIQGLSLRALAAIATPGARAALQRLGNSLTDPRSLRFIDRRADDPDEARARQIASLSRAEGSPPRALIELAADPSEDAQRAVLRYLEGHEFRNESLADVVRLAPASTVHRIAERIERSLPSAQQGLVEGLGMRGDPQFASTLRAALHSDPQTRSRALTALVELGDDAALQEARRLTSSRDPGDRRLALQLLESRPDAIATPDIERLASDPDVGVASRALHALQERSPELVKRLAERAFRNAKPGDRPELLSQLSDLKTSLSRPLLGLALADSDDAVATQAIQTLGIQQGAVNAAPLLSIARDSNRSEPVRREAAIALRALGGPWLSANRALIDSLSPEESTEYFVCNLGY